MCATHAEVFAAVMEEERNAATFTMAKGVFAGAAHEGRDALASE